MDRLRRLLLFICCCLCCLTVVDAAGCYVRLHGFGLATGLTEADTYIAIAANGVVYVDNVSRPPAGFYTYILDPSNCTADDYQFFDTHDDADESPRLINYLQALANGRSLIPCSPCILNIYHRFKMVTNYFDVVGATLLPCVLCRWRMTGDIFVGFSADEAANAFSTAARDMMWNITGVDVRPIVDRGKFVFVSQIGSPQIAGRAHRTGSPHKIRSTSKTGRP